MSPNGGTPYKGFNYTMNHNGVTEGHGGAAADYITDVISATTIDFINRMVDEHADQPFFAYVAPYAPHSPATPAPRHAKAFKGIQAPRTSSWNESDVSDKPNWVRSLPLLNSTQIKDIDKLYRARRQSLLAVDEMVQSIVNTLQAKGQLGTTYIFFTSDNGFHQGQHRPTQCARIADHQIRQLHERDHRGEGLQGRVGRSGPRQCMRIGHFHQQVRLEDRADTERGRHLGTVG